MGCCCVEQMRDTRGYVQDVCEMGSHYFDLGSKDVIAELFLWVYEIKWMMVMGANDNKSPSNTLYSRHSLSHRDSPIITEYARSPREDTLPPLSPSTSPAGGGGGRREGCQVDAEWQKSCEPDKRVSQVIHPSTFSPLPPHFSHTQMPSRAEELFAKAEKKAASSVGWFGSSSSKWEEAADLFSQVSVSMPAWDL